MKKQNWISILAEWCYEKVWKKYFLQQDKNLYLKFKKLYPKEKDNIWERIREHRISQIKSVILGVIAGIIMIIIFLLISVFFSEEEFEIQRNSYGEGDSVYTIYTKSGDEIDLNVKERQYEKTQLEQEFQKAYEYIKENMKGENSSYDEVREPLYFFETIPESGLSVEFFPEDTELIGYDGVLNAEKMTNEGQMTKITAIVSYGEESRQWEIPLCVYCAKLSKEQTKKQKLTEKIMALEEKTREKQSFFVPVTLAGEKIDVGEKNKKIFDVFFLLIIVLLLYLYKKEYEISQKVKKRQRQVQRDFSGIVSQLQLLVGAGWSVKLAFYHMAQEYLQEEQERYAYEELLVMVRQLKGGVSEKCAYEEFAIRIGDLSYQRFMAFILSNLSKGTGEVLKLLKQEEKEVFRQRIDKAKIMGEEAGTKLLFPMILMLVIIMLIIIFPAILNF